MGVIRWIQQGKLKAYTTPGGHYRIRVADFRDFLERFRIPVDEAFFEAEPRSILVVANDSSVLALIVRALSSMPERCKIELVPDGSTAIARIPELNPALVILDVVALGTDDPDSLQQLRTQLQRWGTPTLILGGSMAGQTEEEQPFPVASGQLLLQRDALDVKTLQSAAREVLNR
jgi:CheY-like chemotaxis protein